MSRLRSQAKQLARQAVARVAGCFGDELKPRRPMPPVSEADAGLWRAVAPYTMTSEKAIYALGDAVRYVVANDIPGAIVECGVWRGGSMMAAARVLLELGKTDVHLYLFDTFDGMTAPTERDVEWSGEAAADLLAREHRDETSTLWAHAPLEQVRHALSTIPYPQSRIHFVRGPVEGTIPQEAPERIAILRLDTDWYESTRHELVHLYPRLSRGGVLIVDDYGWWRGAREATDEYFRQSGAAPLLARVDDGGVRLAIKTGDGPAP